WSAPPACCRRSRECSRSGVPSCPLLADRRAGAGIYAPMAHGVKAQPGSASPTLWRLASVRHAVYSLHDGTREAAMTGFFPGFEHRRIATSGADINLVTGGGGPPLLLLHGYPQTHLMWRKLASRLAADFTVVGPDLRGYGDSSKPPGGADNAGYSKRALALDQVETMAALGFERFAVAGHDRGARVAHRLARDHADRVERLALLDIVPTLYRFETIDQKAATSSWHWFFLIQPRGFPERLIGAEAEFFLRHQLGALLRDPAKLEPAAFAEYLRCFKNPETIRATCDEYRAGA